MKDQLFLGQVEKITGLEKKSTIFDKWLKLRIMLKGKSFVLALIVYFALNALTVQANLLKQRS